MTFLNAALLFGLAAVVIPPIVHLFSRRKFEVVDWAAMQFLQLSTKTRRKIFLEHFWLMLLRVLVVALLVFGLAAPQVTSRFFGTVTASGPRDVVVLIDGSASMSYQNGGMTAADSARQWVDEFIGRLNPGDRVAVFQVKATPVPIVPSLTADRTQARTALELLSSPKGTADWPAAVQAALTLLNSGHPNRDVVVVSDNQRYGWADETTLAKWDLIRRGVDRTAPDAARVWVANVAKDRKANPTNWSLEPITSPRGVAAADREMVFRSAIKFAGEGQPGLPGEVTLEVDGKSEGTVIPGVEGDSLSLTVRRKFSVGSHLVTFKLADDALPSDNRQDYAVEVLPLIPLLIIDGSTKRGSDFLRDALAPAKDPNPAFAVRTVAAADWSADLFNQDVKGTNTAPRVVVLFNVEKLSSTQQTKIEKYLADGGSVLVTAGDRTDAANWNRVAFRGGQGFLPARLIEPVGDESDPANAPRVITTSLAHPALEIFKEPLPGGLHTAYFPRRWKVDLAAGANGTTGTTAAMFSTREPLLVERSFGRGRVMLATHPLDNSWKTNLVRLPDFVRLAHELLYSLAGTRTAERNLNPNQPIVFTPRPAEPVGPVAVVGPDGRTRTLNPENWPVVAEGTGEPGPYKLTSPGGRVVYFAVRNDSREAVLTPTGDDDKRRVAEVVGGMQYEDDMGQIASHGGGSPVSAELWWPLLMLVIAFLALEVVYTRKLTDRGEHSVKAD
ncbi:MAG: VWA domain-containing protein [Fimbriiglobus sp.]|nr:VWA domain-containing protein [Fimbriiglobus sp.]